MAFIQFQFRRGTSTEWFDANPILAIAEIAIETDTQQFKVGDGFSRWNELPYGGIQGPIGYTGSRAYTGSRGYTGSTGESDYSISILKNENYISAHRDSIIADTSNNTFTITLPATPSINDRIRIYDGYDFSTNSLIVSGNGNTIENQEENLVINIRNAKVELIYDGNTWQIYSDIGKSGFTGSKGLIGYTGSRAYTGSRGFTGSMGPTGIIVSSTEPENPILNLLWLQI
jgi:hypothetical protein